MLKQNSQDSQERKDSEIESILKEKMDWALFENDSVSGFLDEYFMSGEIELGLESLAASLSANESKEGFPLRRDDGRGARREGSGIPTQRENPPFPPNTNRGVGKYKDQFESRTITVITPEVSVTSLPILGGYDGGVEVGFEGQWDSQKFTALLAILESAKQQASEQSQPVCTTIDGVSVMVNHSGVNAGMHYKYQLTFDGVKFFIHSNPPKGRQGVRIRYSATALIGRSLFALHNAVLGFLETLGFTVTEEKISRVDMQVMLFCKTSELVLPILNGCGVAKAKKYKIQGEGKRLESYTLGKANRLQICIYDKRSEMDHMLKSDPVKWELMYRRCLGAESLCDERPLTRVEFRLWRDSLRAMNINTVKDLQERETFLAEWLTSNWFRILEKQKVRGHENTAAIHPRWLEVQEAFRKWFPGIGDDNKPVEWVKEESVSCDPIALEKQGIGCFASAYALRYGIPASITEVLNNIRTMIEPFIPVIFNKSGERAKQMGINKGVKLGVRDACDTSSVRESFEDFFGSLGQKRIA
jgi:hypothetical protein